MSYYSEADDGISTALVVSLENCYCNKHSFPFPNVLSCPGDNTEMHLTLNYVPCDWRKQIYQTIFFHWELSGL